MNQSGTSLNGSWRAGWDASRTDTFSGTVSAPDRVRVEFSFFCDTWDLQLNQDFTAMTGTTSCPTIAPSSLSLTR
jgi:hypothetical protein